MIEIFSWCCNEKICGGRTPVGAMEYARWSQISARNADLRYALLTGARLFGMDLRGADFRYANLQGANLEGADLAGAKVEFARFLGAKLSGIRHIGVDWSHTYITPNEAHWMRPVSTPEVSEWTSGAFWSDYSF